MRPREPTHTFERTTLTSVVASTSESDPNAIVGQLQFLDLGSGARRTAAILYPRADRATHEELLALRELVFPREPGRPPPEVTVEVAIEFDRSLRLVRFERRTEPDGDDLTVQQSVRRTE